MSHATIVRILALELTSKSISNVELAKDKRFVLYYFYFNTQLNIFPHFNILLQQGVTACLVYFQDLVEKSVRGTLPASMSGCVKLRPITDSSSQNEPTTATNHVTNLRANDSRSQTEQTTQSDHVTNHASIDCSLLTRDDKQQAYEKSARNEADMNSTVNLDNHSAFRSLDAARDLPQSDV